MSTIIGYARTSTVEQGAGLQAQLRDLRKAGAKKVFQEQVSSVAKRAQLEAAIDYLRDGDVFVVTKLDRLARSMKDLLQIVERIRQQGGTLKVLSMNLDTSTATGQLMLNVLGSVAEFERSMMLERQREGIEKARRAGKYKGRQPTARAKTNEVLKRIKAGERPAQIARDLGIGRSSVYRIIQDARGLVEDRPDTRH